MCELPRLSGTAVMGKASARGEWPRRHGRHAIDARPTAASRPSRASPPPRSPPFCSRRACATSGCEGRGALATRAGASGRVAPSPCGSCRRARIWRPRNHGPRRARPGPRSKRCRLAASRSSTPWASPTPGSSATSCAGECTSGRWRRWSPTVPCAISPASAAWACRSGATASPLRPPSPASPSSAGRSRSAAAGSPCSPTT